MRNQILVTGADGLVGSKFVELFPQKDLLFCPTEKEMDLTNADNIREVTKGHVFSSVVHFAAYTNVNEAEKQRGDKNGICWKVNVEGVKNLLSAINLESKHFIHISTDMVFSGGKDDKGPYIESKKPENDLSKLTWYGFTKGEAERFLTNYLAEKATILRLIYPVRAKFSQKLDYLRKPLQMFDQGKIYPFFNDQQISISFIDETAKVISKLINEQIYGIFHSSTPDIGTPYDIISYLIEKARGVKNALQHSSLVEFVKTSQLPEYRYPQFGGLRVDETQKKLGLSFSKWREVIDNLILQGLDSS